MALERAQKVFLAGYVNARATAEALKAMNPETVQIVAMGRQMKEPTPEEERCARYLKHLLGAGGCSHLKASRETLWSPETQKFLKADKSYYPPEDPLVCLQLDLSDLALLPEKDNGLVVVPPQTQAPAREYGGSF